MALRIRVQRDWGSNNIDANDFGCGPPQTLNYKKGGCSCPIRIRKIPNPAKHTTVALSSTRFDVRIDMIPQ